MKNIHHSSPQHERQRRYPFLIAIDLLVHFALSIAAIVLSVVALTMTLHAISPMALPVPW